MMWLVIVVIIKRVFLIEYRFNSIFKNGVIIRVFRFLFDISSLFVNFFFLLKYVFIVIIMGENESVIFVFIKDWNLIIFINVYLKMV